MKLFAIGDLHLSGACPKPMDIFGPNWDDHAGRIARAWRAAVGENDTVLIPGDISWAMKLGDAEEDLRFIAGLPGKKILLRGNHDYWWNSLAKVRGILPEGMIALQNDAAELCEGVYIAGSRGWICPGSAGFNAADDQKIYDRETVRLELSLGAVPKGARIIGMLHYPPFNEKRLPSAFTALFEKYGVEQVVYGHIHGKSCKNAFEGSRNGVEYMLCSADHIGFEPRLLNEF